MNKRILPLALALCLLLTGCASLLERSYSMVEPYTDRFWESGVEDTLKVENYQDLVNSLLMQVEQRAGECVIRFYEEPSSDAYTRILKANREVREESVLGSYLLRRLSFSFEQAEDYYTLRYQMTYREDTEDPNSLMTISDSQSLVDLLRLAVREEHKKLTAQFVYDMPREEVTAAVEKLWQELCPGSREEDGGAPEELEQAEGQLPESDQAEDQPDQAEEQTAQQDRPPEGQPPEEQPPEEQPPEEPDQPSGEAEAPEEGQEQPTEDLPEEEPDPEPVQYPPCPWEIRFYPDLDQAGIVEILLG